MHCFTPGSLCQRLSEWLPRGLRFATANMLGTVVRSAGHHLGCTCKLGYWRAFVWWPFVHGERLSSLVHAWTMALRALCTGYCPQHDGLRSDWRKQHSGAVEGGRKLCHHSSSTRREKTWGGVFWEHTSMAMAQREAPVLRVSPASVLQGVLHRPPSSPEPNRLEYENGLMQNRARM